MHEITLEHSTDTGHRIVGHKGKCARLHGHTYFWVVTMRCLNLRPPGFVVDFGDVKAVLNEWDHYTLLWHKDPVLVAERVGGRIVENSSHVIRVPFNPTAENMAKHMAQRLQEEFNLQRCEIVLHETPKSKARWVA